MMEPLYFKNFADVLDYETLLEIDWIQRENTPRKEYWDTTLNKPYTYGAGRGVRTYEPNENLDLIEYYRAELLVKTGVYFEGCFLNKYDTRKDWLGWHSDDDAGIDHTCPIAVISFGQNREINWKEIGSKGVDSINKKVLENGSLFIMPAGMQQTHLHRIPKMSYDPAKPRVSLTFRKLLS